MKYSLGRIVSRSITLVQVALRTAWYRWVAFAWVEWQGKVTFSGPLHCLGVTGRIIVGNRAFFGPWVSLSVARNGRIEIGEDVSINKGSVLSALQSIVIGARCRIGENVSIRDNDHRLDGRIPIHGSGFVSAPVTIGADVWIGRNATIMHGVTIGEGAVIGAQALIRQDVPAFAVVGGIPARLLRDR